MRRYGTTRGMDFLMSEIPTVTIPLLELIHLRQDSFELEQLRRLIYRGFFSSASNAACEDINRIFNDRDSIWRDLVDDYHDTIEKEEEKEQ